VRPPCPLRRPRQGISTRIVDPGAQLVLIDRGVPRTPSCFGWDAIEVNDYLVAAHDARRAQMKGQVPEVKHHAYLPGAQTTACGFGLKAMRLFRDLRFSEQAPAERCPICSRIVGAGDR
jgi:hypothetical protein